MTVTATITATARLFSRCLQAAAVAAVLAAPASAGEATEGAAGKALVVAVNRDDPPFGYIDPTGEPTGFSVEFARALCTVMAATCRLEPTRFQEVLGGVTAGKFDFAVANVLRTPEREAQVDFSNRYFRSSSCFIGRPGLVAGTAPADLAGRVIGVTAGSVQERWLRAAYHRSTIMVLPSVSEATAALLDGSADLMLAPTMSSFDFLISPEGGAFEIIGEPFHDQGLGGEVAIPVAKGRDDLRRRLNDAIAVMERDGILDGVVLRYFPFRVR
ncbi:MAG TPA: transporter substrate-binding domain-containing protein [Azospirillum sp.]|nr:transporter substrate-binding domain-containing protein [Azospirillum sp.]